MEVKNVAKVVLDSMRIREQSYNEKQYEIDLKKARVRNPESFGPDPAEYYLKDLYESCEQACRENRIDKNLAQLVYLALSSCWNECEGWAGRVLK
ncbi:MAG: hypothetical protein FVQ80_07160 [Planctomycetes bacterium]|nr:hypothetical protein [Planctomycetota bacterium]